MAEAVLMAAEDGGLTQQCLQKADLLITTSLFSDDGIINPSGCVADKLHLPDARCMISGFGGIMPHAMLLVNQAAALIVTSEKQARKMGIEPSKWVYVHGYAEANDHWHILEREAYGFSPAIEIVGRTALMQAGVTIEDIDFFDLYSCFPVAVQVTRDMLGIPGNDNRPLTVTGGLPCFGGPGNNYVMHSMAQMVEVLRQHPGKTGLVTGNSFYMSKHSAAVCTTRSLKDNSAAADISLCQQAVDQRPRHKIDPQPSGRATVETYTVIYDRNNMPGKGVVIGKEEDGKRFAAYTPTDQSLFEAMIREDFCGITGSVVSKDKVNIFTPD